MMVPSESKRPPIVKGRAFTAKVREICRHVPEPCPLPDLKYKRIVIPGVLGGESHFALLGFIAHALRIRGADVTILLCDKLLPACTARKAEHYESACDRWCYKNSGPFVEAMQLSHRWYSEFISKQEQLECDEVARNVPAEDIISFQWQGISIGEHVRRSINSYFRVGYCDLSNQVMLTQARQFLKSALYMKVIAQHALDDLMIDKVFVEDGQKVDWGVFRSVAIANGVPVDVARGSTRKESLEFELDRPDTLSMFRPGWQKWKDIPLTEQEEHTLDEYFATRITDPYPGRPVLPNVVPSQSNTVRKKIGLPASIAGKVFGIFPNVGLDAGLTARTPAYDVCSEWVCETIKFFEKQPDHHLVVKVHPVELERAAKDPTVEILKKQFENLPPNVHLLAPDTCLAAIDVIKELDVSLVYTSTIAAESLYLGTPVVLAGGGVHAGMGVATEVTTPEEYMELLHELCNGRTLTRISQDIARRYNFAIFFRATLPITYYGVDDWDVSELRISSLDEVRPGRCQHLDTICRGVLCDEPYENPEHATPSVLDSSLIPARVT